MLTRLKGILTDFFQQADLVLLGLCCASTIYGILMIFSATRWTGNNRYVIVQAAAMLLGIFAYIFISMVDVETLVKKRWKWIAAFNVLFFLLLKTPFGVSDNTGNTAWLKFPGIPVSIGPAEVVKITFVVLLARQLEWLREERQDLKSFHAALYVAGHTFGLCGLYFLVSGDMGNALVFLFIFLAMSFVAGFALRWFALLFAGGTVAIAGAWLLDLIPSYMVERFRVLFDHSYSPMDAGWQQTRSLMTIGGGGIFGQGYLNGTQTQAGKGSLPARHTDLIFAVIGEELGLVGCLAVLILLAAIIIRVLIVARNSESSFHCFICVGMAAMLIFQIMVNVGMCLFVMPVIGLTLPFFSYGGSSIVTLYAAMGVVSGIKKRSPSFRRRGRTLN